MIPFVPAVRALHVHLRLSTPALVHSAGCPPPFASSRRSRRARLPGARGSRSSFDGRAPRPRSMIRRRALIRTRPKPIRLSTSRLRPRRWPPSARHAFARRRSTFALSAFRARAHLSALPISIASAAIAAPRSCSASEIERTFRCSRSRPRRLARLLASTDRLSLLRFRVRRSSVALALTIRLATTVLTHVGCSWFDAHSSRPRSRPPCGVHARVRSRARLSTLISVSTPSIHVSPTCFGRALTTPRYRMEAAFAAANRPHT